MVQDITFIDKANNSVPEVEIMDNDIDISKMIQEKLENVARLNRSIQILEMCGPNPITMK